MVDQPEIHVLIHVCLFETLASDTVSEKNAWLDIDVVPSECLFIVAAFVKVLVAFLVLIGNVKLVQPLSILVLTQLKQLLEGDCFETGSVCFLLVEDQDFLALHFGQVGSQGRLLKPRAQYDILGVKVLLLKGERKLLVKLVCLFHQLKILTI